MASPQTENGYTRIANEILEQIVKTNLNGTQLKIIMVIWRYTYGFKRKQHELSSSFISESLGGKDRKNVGKELKNLIERKFIIVVGRGKRGANVLKFNKNHEEWIDSVGCISTAEQGGVQLHGSTGVQLHGKSGVQLHPQERKKENIKKIPRKQKTYDEENTYFKMAVYFHDRVSKVAQEAGVGHLTKKANLQKWADEFRKLVELDGVDKHLAKKVMDWVTTDSFWKTNVLSAKKLRDKFGELAIKMNAAQKPKVNQVNGNIEKVAHPNDATRDKEIEFQQWIMEGNDPNEFDWS
ncbi:replication protein [Metabacillus halosaccharovorans]|uniref:replication protein n=1 Tax=Metabacillus halosaccharovorans TaxID=930124 RepID=UPI000994AEAA|nr:replication protein [Metabacillus halosaccharovorans]